MPGETLSFPIEAPDRASKSFRDVGNSALDASGKIDLAAASLKVWDDTSAKSKKATDNLVASKLTAAKADKALSDAESFVSGEADKAARTMAVLKGEVEDSGQEADKAAGFFSKLGGGGGGGFAGGGMGALIGAGVALAPILITVGTGLTGLAAAAYGIYKPISNAEQATGGLTANMSKLNPEQRQVAEGILYLGKTFAGFQSSLQPTVLGLFNRGLQLAAVLLHDVEPVAEVTGKALGTMVGQIGGTFQDGTWQQFFRFMQQTAAPDIALLSANFTSLLNALPPLVEQLQPVSVSLLTITNATFKLIGGVARFTQSIGPASQHTSIFNQVIHGLATLLFAPGAGLLAALKLLGLTGGSTAKALTTAGLAAGTAGPPFFDLAKAISTLNTSMTTLVGNLLTLQGDNVSWRQSLQAAETQLKSNTAGLEGNSKNALANKQAVIASSQAAITFASNQLTLGKNIGQASRTVQTQINWLESLRSKSSVVRQEIEALRQEEQKLAAEKLNQTINVEGLGHWQVSQSLAPGVGHRRAMGGLIPGHGSGDTYPALLTPGELVVPKGMVASGAVDHLRGRLPGFAGGGLVPSYSGSPAGLTPWVQGNDKATISLIDEAVVRATVAGIKAASSVWHGGAGVAGPGGGAPAANAALARRMMPAWGSGAEWAAWNYVAMRESGWSQFARNPSSGAYGIPQALPPGKMGAAANPPQSNPAAQISWMIGYMKSVYRDPIGAAAHERAFNWYDNGGWLKPGLTLAYNGTGRPEMVVPNHGGGAPRVVLEIVGNDSETSAFLVGILRRHARVMGGGDVQVALGRR